MQESMRDHLVRYWKTHLCCLSLPLQVPFIDLEEKGFLPPAGFTEDFYLPLVNIEVDLLDAETSFTYYLKHLMP